MSPLGEQARRTAAEQRVTTLFRRWEDLEEAEIAELRRLHDALLGRAKKRASRVSTPRRSPAAGL